LVERTTRFVVLVHLPGDRKTEAVRDTMQRKIATLPEAMLRSITWDQGKEMSTHAAFKVDTGIQIYFCEPHHPGGVERTRTPMGCSASTCRGASTSPP